MVVTASDKHAVRVMQAVLEAMPTHPELAEFVVGDRAEPFDVLPIAQRRRPEPRPRRVLARATAAPRTGAC